MAHKRSRSIIVQILYCLLAFLMALLMFSLVITATLSSTIFSSSYILDNMNSSNYFVDKKDEITVSLTDLGYASGIDESFFDNLIDEVDLHNDTKAYLDGYYNGKTTVIDDTVFKQNINEALDKYISKTNKTAEVNGKSRDYFINRCSAVYRASLEIPAFSKISSYFVKAKSLLFYANFGIAFFILLIGVVIFFTNKWKHRALKYFCYATSGAFLATAIIPIVAIISKKYNYINFESRALNNLFIQCSNNLFITLAVCSVFLLLVSLFLYFWYRKKKQHAEK